MKVQNLFCPIIGLNDKIKTDVDDMIQEFSGFSSTLFVDWKDV